MILFLDGTYRSRRLTPPARLADDAAAEFRRPLKTTAPRP